MSTCTWAKKNLLGKGIVCALDCSLGVLTGFGKPKGQCGFSFNICYTLSAKLVLSKWFFHQLWKQESLFSEEMSIMCK